MNNERLDIVELYGVPDGWLCVDRYCPEDDEYEIVVLRTEDMRDTDIFVRSFTKKQHANGYATFRQGRRQVRKHLNK